MSLARGLTTISTKKPKQKKLTKAQHDKLTLDWRAYNKRMRQQQCHSLQIATLDDYIAYCFGKRNTSKAKSPQYTPSKTYRRETKHYPSISDGCGVAVKQDPTQYTGKRQLLGIATMHKSNAVPIFADDKEYAKDIAKMRRN